MAERKPGQSSDKSEQVTKQRAHWANRIRKTGRYLVALAVPLAIGVAAAQGAPRHKSNEIRLSPNADRSKLARAKTNRYLDAKIVTMATDVLKLYATKNPSEISYSLKLSSTKEEIETNVTSTAAAGFKATQHPVWRLQTIFNTGPEGQLNPDNIHAINLVTENSEDSLIKGPDSRIRGFHPTANSFSVVGYTMNSNNRQSLVVASDDPKPKEQFMTFADAEAAVSTDLHFIHSAMRRAPVNYIPLPFAPKPGVINPVVLG